MNTLRITLNRNDVADLLWALDDVLADYEDGEPVVKDEQRIRDYLAARLRAHDAKRRAPSPDPEKAASE